MVEFQMMPLTKVLNMTNKSVQVLERDLKI